MYFFDKTCLFLQIAQNTQDAFLICLFFLTICVFLKTSSKFIQTNIGGVQRWKSRSSQTRSSEEKVKYIFVTKNAFFVSLNLHVRFKNFCQIHPNECRRCPTMAVSHSVVIPPKSVTLTEMGLFWTQMAINIKN